MPLPVPGVRLSVVGERLVAGCILKRTESKQPPPPPAAARSRTQVDRLAAKARRVDHLVHRRHVAGRQVHHVDIVADGGAVWGAGRFWAVFLGSRWKSVGRWLRVGESLIGGGVMQLELWARGKLTGAGWFGGRR